MRTRRASPMNLLINIPAACATYTSRIERAHVAHYWYYLRAPNAGELIKRVLKNYQHISGTKRFELYARVAESELMFHLFAMLDTGHGFVFRSVKSSYTHVARGEYSRVTRSQPRALMKLKCFEGRFNFRHHNAHSS